jgi:hypothetical protein
MSTKSKKKSKAKAKASAKQKAASLPVNLADAASATDSTGGQPDVTDSNDLTVHESIESKATDTPDTEPLEFSETPLWQRIFLIGSLALLAVVVLIGFGVGFSGTPQQTSPQVSPANTPGGSTTIEVGSDTPLMQETNPVQAAPAINSGSVSNDIQQGTGDLQQQGSGLQ